jgi:hypothetical protein
MALATGTKIMAEPKPEKPRTNPASAATATTQAKRSSIRSSQPASSNMHPAFPPLPRGGTGAQHYSAKPTAVAN